MQDPRFNAQHLSGEVKLGARQLPEPKVEDLLHRELALAQAFAFAHVVVAAVVRGDVLGVEAIDLAVGLENSDIAVVVVDVASRLTAARILLVQPAGLGVAALAVGIDIAVDAVVAVVVVVRRLAAAKLLLVQPMRNHTRRDLHLANVRREDQVQAPHSQLCEAKSMFGNVAIVAASAVGAPEERLVVASVLLRVDRAVESRLHLAQELLHRENRRVPQGVRRPSKSPQLLLEPVRDVALDLG
mmetsp:Transcript_37939/g.108770  ORF Transcript_37939/g.108770 Transcript_37939/m.108770 type:complete len:243 (-) Transcript_37939:270-998(-)